MKNKYVVNEYGKSINYEIAENMMDDEIRESLCGYYFDEQSFFDAYCAAHKEKYGEEFELAKANPVY